VCGAADDTDRWSQSPAPPHTPCCRAPVAWAVPFAGERADVGAKLAVDVRRIGGGGAMRRADSAVLLQSAPAADVPFVDLRRQHAAVAGELRGAFDRVLGSSAFVLGEEVAAFENEFAAYCGARHCVGVASGTAALTLALLGAGIGPGDEVIVPGHTFIASALAVAHAGAEPVFCDVYEDTGLLDVGSAAAVVSDRTAAIVAVHLYGQVCDMDAIGELARRHGLFVLEDAAQAHGATHRGRRTGSLGSAAAFSFYPSKNLGALGDGGAICTDDRELADRARRLGNLGQRSRGEHVELGFNERLDGLQAALLRVKLHYLDAGNAARRRHAATYMEGLGADLRTLKVGIEMSRSYHLFPIRVADRSGAAAFLAKARIRTAVHYTPAAFEHPAWKGWLAPHRVSLDQSRAWARDELSLPMFPELELAEVHRVVDACNAWLEQN
jgi:dTDP-3-amino-3,4,6-trideoxy-alpha-D-glucose transaminase